MAGCRGDCPFLVQIGWRYFSLFTDTWARQGLTSNLSKHITCVSRTYFNLSLSLKINLHTSLCVSPGKLSEFSLSKHLTCVSRTYSQLQPSNLTYFSLLISRQVVGVFTVQTPHLCLQDSLPTSACRDILNAHLQASCRSLHCPNTSLVSPGLTPNLSLSRYSKHFKNMSSPAINWQVTFNKWPYSQHATKMKWNKTHITWIKNTQALRCPWLYISNVPT